ncbi:hypothetical protein ON058_02060 [Demequina sp. B12]|uniref:hypothetical protein n=1 Tax=Demequina sp. B12 TaxID=2992757 RepID=UPI00237B21D0|nr:hypothetical protein [Demequina sp. B12]MDE0572195.1 hypothetical protein [Demequina sp. B12]
MNATPEFYTIKQRYTLGVNRYEIRRTGEDFEGGEQIAFAQQKRMKLKEEIVFYKDDTKAERVFSFKARNVMDVKSVVDVFDENHQPIGTFSKDFAKSLLNSTWYLEIPGLPQLTANEDSTGKAIARRFINLIPYNFSIHAPDGSDAMTIKRKGGVRDLYRVAVYDTRYDERVVLSLMVALDSLQDR